MTIVPIVVEVPDTDAADLNRLEIGRGSIATGHGLDGSGVTSGILILTATTLPLLRTWLNARVEQRKAATVILKGRRLVGYTADEVVKIIKAIEEAGPFD